MAFKIEDLRSAPSGAMYVSPERICLTADGELCEETDTRAVTLLVAKGSEIPAAEAAKYGLIASAEAPKPADEPEDLSTLTVPQLRERAEEIGVDLEPRSTKAQIIAAIEAAADNEDDEGDTQEGAPAAE